MSFTRDAGRLDQRFDLLVVGGGIYGAWIAYDAALRGLSVALVEARDWAAGTSSASSKLIHGGLRYLEYGWFGLVAKALRERARLVRLAPHRVRPLRFLLPLYPDARAGRLALKAALTLYDGLAGARPEVGRHRAFAADDLMELAPFLDPRALAGGFAYGDASEDDARLTLELAAGAAAAGAVALNRCEVVRLMREGDRVIGAQVVDRVDGSGREVRARTTVVAAGAWSTSLAGLDDTPALGWARYTKGSHLVMPALPSTRRDAFLLTAPGDRRVFFLIPWYGRTLLGTTDTDWRGDPSTIAVDDADTDYLLTAAARRCPGLGWTRADVHGAFAGLRTLRASDAAHPGAVNREWSLESPLANLLVPIGGKLTSARVEACQTVDRVFAALGRRAPACATARRPLPWAPGEPWRPWLADAVLAGVRAGLDAATAANAARRYGRTLPTLLARVTAYPAHAARIVPDLAFCWAELAHAAAHEQALDLADVLRRRVPLAILARLNRATVERAAAIVGVVLDWDAAQRASEVERVLARSTW
ncbi:MAG TPA: glycerol-3-phosphate dehydrogenase/oxidase [Planctomycetota bacterium]|nr:glycerol-3-phosphate dehydrogenase/oxidase [Planctomycetota bacterium]